MQANGNVKTTDVIDRGSFLDVTIPKTKTNITRRFSIENPYREIVLKYINLRPANVDNETFFLNFQKGKCTTQVIIIINLILIMLIRKLILQVIGKNKLGNTPNKIVKFLNLPNPQLYTGHSFRRTSTTLLNNSGASMMTLKRHGA